MFFNRNCCIISDKKFEPSDEVILWIRFYGESIRKVISKRTPLCVSILPELKIFGIDISECSVIRDHDQTPLRWDQSVTSSWTVDIHMRLKKEFLNYNDQ